MSLVGEFVFDGDLGSPLFSCDALLPQAQGACPSAESSNRDDTFCKLTSDSSSLI